MFDLLICCRLIDYLMILFLIISVFYINSLLYNFHHSEYNSQPLLIVVGYLILGVFDQESLRLLTNANNNPNRDYKILTIIDDGSLTI